MNMNQQNETILPLRGRKGLSLSGPEMKHLKIRIQSLNPIAGFCDSELNLLVWQIGFLQMPWFENQIYCLTEVTHLCWNAWEQFPMCLFIQSTRTEGATSQVIKSLMKQGPYQSGEELGCLWYSVLATSLPNQHLLWSPNKKQEYKGTQQQDVIKIVSWNPSRAWKPELKVWIYWLFNSRAIISRMLHFLMRQKRKVNKCLGSEVRQIWIWILLRLRFPYLWIENNSITLLY